VEQSNFNDYNVMRMSDMPDELNIASSTAMRRRRLGRGRHAVRDAAIANAFYRLTGKRLYTCRHAERVRTT